jgi:DNA-binding NarL/FixJ family response regulator
MKIFIADDSAIIRERLIAMLSELEGLEVVGEAQGQLEAIKSIQELRPDAVILDIRMAGGSGIEVLRTIRQRGRTPLVIMFTNYPYPQYRKRCMEAGADYFLDKSTEFDKMLEVFGALIPAPAPLVESS